MLAQGGRRQGASHSLSPVHSDIITLKKVKGRKLKTISSDVAIKGVGMIEWQITDEKGVTSTITIEAFYDYFSYMKK